MNREDADTSPLREANAAVEETNSTNEVPSLLRLLPVTVALCTTLFCGSLVRLVSIHVRI
jgi:hypothetical protein